MSQGTLKSRATGTEGSDGAGVVEMESTGWTRGVCDGTGDRIVDVLTV